MGREGKVGTVIKVDLDALREGLSEHVRRASSGETLLIVEHDRVLAELGPPRRTQEEPRSEGPLDALVRDGLVTPATAPGGARPRIPPPRAKLEDLLAELRSDRSRT